MKKHLHIKKTDIPLYRGKLVIIITNDDDKLKKYLPDFKGIIYAHSWNTNVDSYTGVTGYTVVLNFNSPFRDVTLGTIVHEAFHIVNFIAADRGIKSDFENDEALSYLIEWVVEEIYSFIKKCNFEVAGL